MPAPSALVPEFGAHLPDHYQLIGLLGKGGMGVVVKVRDTRLNLDRAAKAMNRGLASSEQYRARFLREARVMANINSDHVMPILELSGDDAEVPYFIMPLLQGRSLQRRLTPGSPFAVAEILDIGREAALGLDAVHAKGLVHRDIKPGNLFLEDLPGGGRRVRILDFGIVRAEPEPGVQPLTESDVLLGSAPYMAPEQTRGERCNARSDLFSLGVVLYELATGRRPAPPDPHALRAHLPRRLGELILQMLSPEPARRPASAAQVAECIRGLLLERQDPLAGEPPDRLEELLAKIRDTHHGIRDQLKQAGDVSVEVLGCLDRRHFLIASFTAINSFIWRDDERGERLIDGRVESILRGALFLQIGPTREYFRDSIEPYVKGHDWEVEDETFFVKGFENMRRKIIDRLRGRGVADPEGYCDKHVQKAETDRFPFTGIGWAVCLLGTARNISCAKLEALLHGPFHESLTLQFWEDEGKQFVTRVGKWCSDVINDTVAVGCPDLAGRIFFERLKQRMRGYY